ncbi:hypothetical protein HKX48_004895 [Thoreauomyces humboldtii]|nr:hypothetical protein HKX48_004895 [Thoreauomyces humboldtii]
MSGTIIPSAMCCGGTEAPLPSGSTSDADAPESLPQKQQPSGTLAKLWRGYFGPAASQKDVSLAWQAVSQIAQTGESLFRIENASWRIWSRRPPTTATTVRPRPPDGGQNVEGPESAESVTPSSGAASASSKPHRRPSLFESYIPERIAALPTAVLERLKHDSVTGTLTSLLGENLSDLIQTAINRAEASGLLDIGEQQFGWRRQSSPSAFIRRWTWLGGGAGKDGLGRSDSAVDLRDMEATIDELLGRIDTVTGDETEDHVGFSLQSTNRLSSSSKSKIPTVPTSDPCAIPFGKRSIHAVSERRPSLLSRMIDQSLREQDLFTVAAQRRRMLRYVRRRAIESEGEDKRGMDVETYMKLMDACDDAAVRRTHGFETGTTATARGFDAESRRKVTDTAQSLIDPTWRTRDTRSRRMPWFEQRRAVTHDATEPNDTFFVW